MSSNEAVLCAICGAPATGPRLEARRCDVHQTVGARWLTVPAHPHAAFDSAGEWIGSVMEAARSLLAIDPFHTWWIEGEAMGTECHFCDGVDGDHSGVCIWLKLALLTPGTVVPEEFGNGV